MAIESPRGGAVTACVLSFLGFCLVAACGSGDDNALNPTTLRDSTGITFKWTCGATGCQMGPGPIHQEGCTLGAHYTIFFNRLVDICFDCIDPSNYGTAYEDCRPAACDTAADCPIFTGIAYDCLHGLCQNRDTTKFPRSSVAGSDFLDACFAKLPRPSTTYRQAPAVEHVYSLETADCPASGGACTVPSECWSL